jgi:hypothetical protein
MVDQLVTEYFLFSVLLLTDVLLWKQETICRKNKISYKQLKVRGKSYHAVFETTRFIPFGLFAHVESAYFCFVVARF